MFARAGASEPFYFAWIVQIAAAEGECGARPCPLSCGTKETAQPCLLCRCMLSLQSDSWQIVGLFSEEGGRDEYWVHFQGWNNRYDRWVVRENLRPVNAGEAGRTIAPRPQLQCDRLRRRRLCSAVIVR